jgi:hypothetical protein
MMPADAELFSCMYVWSQAPEGRRGEGSIASSPQAAKLATQHGENKHAHAPALQD